MRSFRFKALDKPAFNSRIQSDTVRGSERWLGFFLGPSLVASLYAGVSGSYLNSFYTDVLHLSAVGGGVFLALMPVVSKILDAITNIIMGRFVDNTVSPQGKARPWILLSGPIMAVAAIFLFAVPRSNMLITAVWVVFSYNLYFCIAYTMYNLSNVITISVSTRDNKQRDTLAMASSIGINMVPGVILAVIFPSFLLPFMGVDQKKWILVMGIMAILAIPGTLIQYYFTRERVTEETKEIAEMTGTVSLREQVKGCLGSKYWVLIIVAIFIYQFYNNLQVTSMHYYANWVLGTYNDGVTLTLLNVIGQALMGPGAIVLWPIVKKFNKRKIFIVCSVIAAIGGFFGAANAHSMVLVMVGLSIRSIGNLPFVFVMLSMLADALDHVEWKAGFRCDGFSSSIYSIIITVTNGLSLGVFNLGLSLTGYVAPAADGTWVAQSASVQNFFVSGMFIVPAVCAIILGVIFYFFKLENQLPTIKQELEARSAKTAE